MVSQTTTEKPTEKMQCATYRGSSSGWSLDHIHYNDKEYPSFDECAKEIGFYGSSLNQKKIKMYHCEYCAEELVNNWIAKIIMNKYYNYCNNECEEFSRL